MKTIAITLLAATAIVAAPNRPTAPRAGEWKVDAVHSAVVFKIKHVGCSWFYGTFAVRSGKLSLDDKNGGTMEIVLDAGSVATQDDKRNAHLRSPDFFDAKQFPDIKFACDKLRVDGDTITADGQLTLRGKTKPLTLTISKTGEGEMQGRARKGYETSFTIKRSDFGLDYGLAQKALGDEVTLTAGIAVVSAQ